jgi:adenylate cyclase
MVPVEECALVDVRFEPSGRTISVAAGTSLLEAARAAGLPVASACGADGVCGRCGMRILAGDPGPETAAEAAIKRRNRIEPELRLSCRVRVESELVATATYW